MEISEVKELLKVFDESASTYLEADVSGSHVKLMKQGGGADATQVSAVTGAGQAKVVEETATERAQASQESQAKEDGTTVTAPLVGVFYTSPSPEEPSFVEVGSKVKAGDTLCLIEAMKMMNKIVAPKDGTILKVYAKNQEVVGYGDILFLIGD